MGIFDWNHWIVILLVLILVFGTKKLTSFGADLGSSIKGFRKAMQDEDLDSPQSSTAEPSQSHLADWPFQKRTEE
ncbi:Sec-independent protein translocase protein TatA [compost metagenome]